MSHAAAPGPPRGPEPGAAAWAHGWRGDALAAVAGLALPLAFAPFSLWPFALIAPAALFVAWAGATPRRAAWRGWLYGVASFGAGVSWIVESFRFSNVALPLAVVLMLGFVAFLALYPALAGVLLARLVPRSRAAVRLCAAFPAGYVLSEWLRGWLLTGFTWLQIGYSQVDGPLAGLLPLAGVYGAGLAVALAAGALSWLACAPGARPAAVLVAIGAGALAAAHAGALEWTRPAGDPIRVALVQGNVPQERKWLAEMRVPTLERYSRLTEPHLGAALIVWPETALPGRLDVMAPFLDRLGARARSRGSAVLVGVPEFAGAPLRAYNSVVLVGASSGHYRKRHLVPFGEYLPLDRLLRPITRALGIAVSNFSAGADGQPPLVVAGHRVAAFICYEIAFGAEVVETLPDAALLVTVSNDAWFGDTLGPHQHLQMARARSLESGRWLLRATNTGITALIGPLGRVRAALPQFEEGALGADAVPRAGATPYVRTGDTPAIAACLALLVLPVAGARRSRGVAR